jgi:osmotically inducible lipoprotein OsmB
MGGGPRRSRSVTDLSYRGFARSPNDDPATLSHLCVRVIRVSPAAFPPPKFPFLAMIGFHPCRIVHGERSRTMSTRIGILMVAAALLLSACGTNPADRAGSGALIGAGTGAAIGAIAAGPAGAAFGAWVGAAAGGAGGAVTSPSMVNLGQPVWR